jgi:hypothetical protein
MQQKRRAVAKVISLREVLLAGGALLKDLSRDGNVAFRDRFPYAEFFTGELVALLCRGVETDLHECEDDWVNLNRHGNDLQFKSSIPNSQVAQSSAKVPDSTVLACY